MNQRAQRQTTAMLGCSAICPKATTLEGLHLTRHDEDLKFVKKACHNLSIGTSKSKSFLLGSFSSIIILALSEASKDFVHSDLLPQLCAKNYIHQKV